MKRYEMVYGGHPYFESPKGEFVKYEDVKEMVALLKELEWETVDDIHGGTKFCRCCGWITHHEDCRLNNFLKEMENG